MSVGGRGSMSSSAFSISSAVGERRRTAWVALGPDDGAALCGRVDVNVLRGGNLSKCRAGDELGDAK